MDSVLTAFAANEDWSHFYVVAPATADLMAKAAHGLADDPLRKVRRASGNALVEAQDVVELVLEGPVREKLLRVPDARPVGDIGNVRAVRVRFV